MGKHAKISPSGLSRTLNCPGSIRMAEDVPRKASSKYADEGSVYHHLGELCLLNENDASDYVGQVGWHNNKKTGIGSAKKAPKNKASYFMCDITEAGAEAVQVYVDLCRELWRDTIVKIEEKLDMSWLVPGMFGTGDFKSIDPLRKLHIVDYKHGAGVAVDVADNPQLLSYALGALGPDNPYAVEEVVIWVVQPRAPHSDGPVRSATMTVRQLYHWGDDVLAPAAKLALSPDAPVAAGKWCRWCAALDRCPETRKQALTAAKVMFDDAVVPVQKEIELPTPMKLDGDQLNKILHFAEMFESWLKAVKAEAFDRHDRGDEDAPADFKIVAGRSSRKWNCSDEEVFCSFKAADSPRKYLCS